jgi:DNA-binding transcriptional MerR regulator
MEAMELLKPDELERIERDHAGGLPAREILEIFRPRGVQLSVGTFRKYVQAGLLPRSRRVGRKGKHQGSRGLYPVEVVRRINAIKMMMAEGHTLEDIQRSFLFHRNHIDQLERDLAEVLDGFAEQLGGRAFGGEHRRALEEELSALRHRAQALVQDVARLGSAVSARDRDENQRSP